MIRFVVGEGDIIHADIDGKLPGRGIWVSSDRNAVSRACERMLFSRAARRSVRAPDDLTERVESLLVRRLSDLLSLARKSGSAVSGFERVRDELTGGRASLLVLAADGSQRQIGKLVSGAGDVEITRCLTGDELGMAFGRQNVIHVAVKGGGICGRIRKDAHRLAGIRVT